MSRKPKQFNDGLAAALDKFSQAVTGDIEQSKLEATDRANSARWFFLQSSAPPASMYEAFLDANKKPWFAPFDHFWGNLLTRHRAIQLAQSVEGQEFCRFLAFVDLSAILGEEVHEYLSSEGWYHPLTASSSYMDLSIRYVNHLTTVGDLNAHVIQRELQCCIPTADGLLVDPAEAARLFPVTVEVIGELQMWASNALLRGHEAFTNPAVLDTREGEVERLRTLTQQAADPAKIAGLCANHRDRISVCRGRTLERRARVSRSVFFSQATKRGLDHDRSSNKAQ